jgi:hypothetical protein
MITPIWNNLSINKPKVGDLLILVDKNQQYTVKNYSDLDSNCVFWQPIENRTPFIKLHRPHKNRKCGGCEDKIATYSYTEHIRVTPFYQDDDSNYVFLTQSLCDICFQNIFLNDGHVVPTDKSTYYNAYRRLQLKIPFSIGFSWRCGFTYKDKTFIRHNQNHLVGIVLEDFQSDRAYDNKGFLIPNCEGCPFYNVCTRLSSSCNKVQSASRNNVSDCLIDMQYVTTCELCHTLIDTRKLDHLTSKGKVCHNT